MTELNKKQKQAACRRALDLKASLLSDWEKGYIHAATGNSIPDSLYTKLLILCEVSNAQ